MCGGTFTFSSSRQSPRGLSPRVRGNRDRRPGRAQRGGSIPACAGEPHLTALRPARPEVYPRVCGGTWTRAKEQAPFVGLSPRVRGNPRPSCGHPHRRGSIPACAGEPSSRTKSPSAYRVYPRVCGGTAARAVIRVRQAGLSPRVRGNRVVVPGIVWFRRSIPACAGEPPAGAHHARPPQVYPRVCGGTSWTDRYVCPA